MASTQTQLRRGTSSQCDAMVPAEAEVVVDLTNDRLRLGDGLLAGGFHLPNANDIQKQRFVSGTVGGTADAITIALTPALQSYSAYTHIQFIASGPNTGAVTVNINGLGTKNVYKLFSGAVGPLTAGDLITGGLYELSYDGVQFQLLNLPDSGIITVSQGDLNTSQGNGGTNGIVSGVDIIVGLYAGSGSSLGGMGPRLGFVTQTMTLDTSYVLPGGEYGFYPEIARIGTNFNWQQRYINSSPPWDMGDGEVGGFLFLLLDENGDIISYYLSDVPPWGYNGPTNIRATHKCKITGKKFRSVSKAGSLDEIMNKRSSKFELEEITHELKNRDMALIPHPFGNLKEGQSVVLVDPMDDKVRRIIEHQNAGGSADVIEAIMAGKIQIDNKSIKRKGPKGVPVHKMKYKFGGK